MTSISAQQHETIRPEHTTCCIVGCGPAGAMLGLLLARAGVEVLVLEKHEDFFRDFRGDTIHPSTLEIVDELGLFERFARVPQQRASELSAWTDAGKVKLADLRGLGVRHPYISFVPQWDFLDFVTDAAAEYPGFGLRMGAEGFDLIWEGDRVAGIRYRAADGVHEVRAALTVATDGRDSVVRGKAGLVSRSQGAPMDVLWFRLPRATTDPDETFFRLSSGGFVAMIDRGEYWQVGYVVPKGSDAALRHEGIEDLRSSLAGLLPFLADRVEEEPSSWDEVSTLSVQVDRLRRWHRPGLLCLGDAAHAMSPVGGVGINLAVQDAVAAANALAAPLRRGTLSSRDLARVQWRRWLPTVVTQRIQVLVQRRVLVPVVSGRGRRASRVLAAVARLRMAQRIPARLFAVGVLPEHVRSGSIAPATGRRGEPAGAATPG